MDLSFELCCFLEKYSISTSGSATGSIILLRRVSFPVVWREMAFMDLLQWVMIVKLAVYQLSECQIEQCEGKNALCSRVVMLMFWPHCSEFDVRPEDVEARAGEMAMMTCYYAQGSSEVLTWDMEMDSITSDSSICDCTILDNGHRLQFNNVTVDNVGRYTCNSLVGPGDARGCSATLKLAGELSQYMCVSL